MIDFTQYTKINSHYVVLRWEPVAGSGEQINVGTICNYKGKIIARRLIREDVLTCMYGASGERLFKMIEWTITSISEMVKSKGLREASMSTPLANFSLSEVHETVAFSEDDLLRQIALMNCSLNVLGEMLELEIVGATKEDSANQRWPTKIKSAVLDKRPDFANYFNVERVITDGGYPTTFGFLSNKLASNFGLLSAANNKGVADARSKMWTLHLAKQREPNLITALICGTNRPDDITVSDKQRNKLESFLSSLHDEAKENSVEFIPVYSEIDAANFIMENA